jgi:lipoate-protein ligase A
MTRDTGSSSLTVIDGQLTGDAPLDTAVSRAILLGVTDGSLPETLQVGTPHRVVAFGKHDTLTKGFDAAVEIARAHGYDTTVRIAGGRAVVFSPTIIRFAWTLPAEDPATTMHERFSMLAEAVVAALATLGVAGAVGEIPGEYCAGRYSVHVLARRKVMGVGQRLTRSAAQVGGMIVVADPGSVNEVLVPVYDALGVAMDPSATGSVADAASVTTDEVSEAFVHQIAAGRPIVTGIVDPSTLERATSLRGDHEPRLA